MKNTQTQHIQVYNPYMKFKLKLLHIKCHVLEFTKDDAKRLLQRITQSFAEAFYLSR
jgi:hypothetical protein